MPVDAKRKPLSHRAYIPSRVSTNRRHSLHAPDRASAVSLGQSSSITASSRAPSTV